MRHRRSETNRMSFPQGETGFSLIEHLIALVIIALALVALILSLSAGSSGVGAVERRVSAENLARSQLEFVKESAYITVTQTTPGPYATIPVVQPGYSITITTQPISPLLQLITVTVLQNNQAVYHVEAYKKGP